MLRYLRLYLHFVEFSLGRAMEFRLDFYFRVVMDTLFYVVNILFFKFVFLHTDRLGGWTEPQVMIFATGYFLVDALHMTLFSNNLWMFPQMINKGDLDYYLVRPVSSLFFVSCREFAANSFLNLLIAVGVAAWAFLRYPEHLGFGAVVMFVFLVLNGTLLFYLSHMAALIPIFWLHSGRGLEYMHWAMTRFSQRPDRIFTGWLRRVLISILPFALIASFPARLVVEPFDWRILVYVIGVTAVMFVLLIGAWRAGLRAYSSASS